MAVDYTSVARNLADTLIRFARDRRDEDRKEIGRLHYELCQLRRRDLEPPPEEQPPA